MQSRYRSRLFVLLAFTLNSTGLAAAAEGAARAREDGKPGTDEGAQTASHLEIEPLPVEFKRLSALRLHPDGDLLACDEEAGEIKLLDPFGQHLSSLKPGFQPQAVDVAANGVIYCGGEGQLAALDKRGEVLKRAPIPQDLVPAVSDRRRGRARAPRISGLAVSEQDVFVAIGSGWSLGSKSRLFRVDRELSHPRVLAEGLRGCCQRCDIVVRDGVVFVAENSAHRVVCYDREGKTLSKWGARSRTGLEGFGSCCNPMNLCFDASGALYTAESGLGRVKRYSIEGGFRGLVGYVGVERFNRAGRQASSCSNIAIAATPSAARVYVMDYSHNRIRVLQWFD